jgi:hypothetical protein
VTLPGPVVGSGPLLRDSEQVGHFPFLLDGDPSPVQRQCRASASEHVAAPATRERRTRRRDGSARHVATGDAGSLLGKHKELCDPPPNQKRRELYDLRDALRPFAPTRSRSCGIARAWSTADSSASPFVHVMLRETDGGTRGHFHGTARCASWSACPVCSSALRIERAREVVEAVKWWRSTGGTVELLTLTLSHGMGDDLRALRTGLQECWRVLWAGAPGKRLRAALGMEHYVRGTDDTHGRNGWHPHLHVVVFVNPFRRDRRAVELLKARWHMCVTKVLGRHHAPSWRRGADIRPCEHEEYVAKLGLELVSTHTKTGEGVTPWQIANRAAAGDARFLNLWTQYVNAMLNVRQLVWSRHVRKAAGLGAELTDEEIVAAEGRDAEETHVASVPSRMWDAFAHVPGALFAVLRAAEDRGRMGVAEAVAQFTYGLAPPDTGDPPDQLTLDLFNSIAPIAQPATRA